MKKKKKKYNIQTERVLPTPEFLKKHEVEEKATERAGEKRMYVTDQLWIDRYYKKNVIDYAQYLTAQRFLALYRATGRAKRITAVLSDLPVVPSSHGLNEGGLNALADFNRLSTLMGKNSFSCVQDVVIYNLSAKEWAIKNSRNVKASAEIFRLSLDDLSDAFKNLKS